MVRVWRLTCAPPSHGPLVRLCQASVPAVLASRTESSFPRRATIRGQHHMNRIRTIRPAVLGGGLVLLAAASAGAQDLTALSQNNNQWVMTGRTYDLQRYSPLNQ